MVQALVNSMNFINTEPAQTQTPTDDVIKDFQRLFDKQTAGTKETEVLQNDKISEDTTITADETNENKSTETLNAELENSQILSRILQMMTQENTKSDDTEFEETDVELGTVELNIQNLSETDDLFNSTLNISEKPETLLTKPEKSQDSEAKTLEDIVDEDILKELNIESIESEFSSEENDSELMQNQTPEEQGIKIMLHSDAEFTEIKPEEIQQSSKPSQTQEANPSKIIEQVSKHMESLKSGSKVNMVLNPESLGKVSIQLINTKEGLSAQFTVATQEARNILMKGLDGLKETLISQGVSVDNVSVKLNDTQETEHNFDWTEQENTGGGNKNQGSGREQKHKDEFEQAMSFVEEKNGKV